MSLLWSAGGEKKMSKYDFIIENKDTKIQWRFKSLHKLLDFLELQVMKEIKHIRKVRKKYAKKR